MPEMDYRKLNGRLREYGYTQKRLALEIGISESHLSQKMNGKYPFKQSEIGKICDLLCIESADIGSYFFSPVAEKTQLSTNEGGT